MGYFSCARYETPLIGSEQISLAAEVVSCGDMLMLIRISHAEVTQAVYYPPPEHDAIEAVAHSEHCCRLVLAQLIAQDRPLLHAEPIAADHDHLINLIDVHGPFYEGILLDFGMQADPERIFWRTF